MRERNLVLATLLTCLAVTLVGAKPQDVDHPLVKRYPGSEILGLEKPTVHEFDEFELMLGPIKEGSTREQNKPTKTLHLEGKITFAKYSNPENRSVLEIYRSYEQALTKAGFQILFACNGKECGAIGAGQEERPFMYDPGYLRRYLAAKLTRPEGDVYVSLAVQAQGAQYTGDTQLDVIEIKPMETKDLVDAAALAGDLTRTGHVAVYGIYFDTGKADIKSESEPTLKEIAKLLQQDALLKLFVVGHTDAVGELAANMDLSKRRAQAVVQELTTKHSVAAARLRADGVGPLAPVATNDTEAGRARNRRVELVKQ